MKLNAILKILIRQRGITTADLARAIKSSPKTISDWLAGNRTPRDLDAVKRCADYFGVSVHYLLWGDEDPRNPLSLILEKSEIHTGLYEISIKKVAPKGDKI